MSTLRIRIDDCRPAFRPRAEWVLRTLARDLGRDAQFTDGEADVTYAAAPPASGVWIPLQDDAQAFFEGQDAFPGPSVHRAGDLTLLFAPCAPDRAIAGDIVASAFYLLARWDEYRVADRDRFGRLPFDRSAFTAIEGLDIEDPAVEGYLGALRTALGLPAPDSWTVFLTHDIDRIRRRTARGIARSVKRRRHHAVRDLAGHDPWDNVPDLLETTWRRGLRSTVFLIGRNRHRLDGTPRRTYERERRNLAAAVHAAGSEVALHGAFASSESEDALQEEVAVLRGEAGDVRGVRFHYLRFRYHDTPLRVERAGLQYDASLGFSERPGFAAGYARPFRPWVVGEERESLKKKEEERAQRLAFLQFQIGELRDRLGVPEGQEWDPLAGLDGAESSAIRQLIDTAPFAARVAGKRSPRFIPTPDAGALLSAVNSSDEQSTQNAFGKVMFEIAKRTDDFSDRVVTTSPDVTVSTNLGGFVNRRGVFHRRAHKDVFTKSSTPWKPSSKAALLSVFGRQRMPFLQPSSARHQICRITSER
jgi:hypothetical protein